MAKDYGGLVFYRTKEGKLRYFDPSKAKTPEGKAKIKAIRSGKKVSIHDVINKNGVDEKKRKWEKAGEENGKFQDKYWKWRGKQVDKYKATGDRKYLDFEHNKTFKKFEKEDEQHWKEIANTKNAYENAEIDLKGTTKTREKLNIQRAQKKIDEQKKPAWVENPNFNYKKYGKYFDNNGVLKKETAGEYLKAYAQARKSADGIREKEAKAHSAEETYQKKLKQNEDSNKELDKLKTEYEKADDNKKLELGQKIGLIQKKRREQGITNNDVSRAGVAARKEKANWENEFDKQAKEADKQVNSIDKLDDWTKKQIEPVKNLSSEEAMSRYKELSSRAQKGGPGSLSKDEENERRALANRLQDKGTGKLKDVLAGSKPKNLKEALQSKANKSEIGDVSAKASKEVEKNVKASLKKAGILAEKQDDDEKFIKDAVKVAKGSSNSDLQALVEAHSSKKFGRKLDKATVAAKTKYEDKLLKEIRNRANSKKKSAWKK